MAILNSMPHTPISIAVVEHDGQFLVGQRPAGSPLGGMWEFPGGKVELDETPAAAAVRECMEETGVDITVAEAYPEHIQQYDHDRVRLYFFACRPIDPARTPREPFRWVRREDLAGLEFPTGNRDVVQRLLFPK